MPDYPAVPGVKIIKLNSSNIDEPYDPNLPWKLEMTFSPPEFMAVAFVLLHGGTERLVAQGNTREDLLLFIELEELASHPRLVSVTFTGPDGLQVEVTKESLRS
jgi:hypothetical protein